MRFGDQLNDIEMLGRAYYSFAIGNARPEVKEADQISGRYQCAGRRAEDPEAAGIRKGFKYMEKKLVCPNCGEPFEIDEKGYAAIAKQVRDRGV